MKRIYFFIIATAVACLSCQKEDSKGIEVDTSGYTMFSANTEEVEFHGSKYSNLWHDGTCIGVYGSESGTNSRFFLKRSGAGKLDAFFYGPLVKGDAVCAYHPYAETFAMENGRFPFMLASVQPFGMECSAWDAFHKCDSLSFASMKTAGNLDFKYPMGVIAVEFHFDEIVNVKQISLVGKNPISGKLLVDADCSVSSTSVSTNVIELNLEGQIVPSKVGDVYTPFYFVLPPAVYAFKDLTLKVSTDTEDMSVILKETTVPRVRSCDFKVASVEITSSDLPGFNTEIGYLE